MTTRTAQAPVTDHRIRLILRVQATNTHRELELAVPSTACLGEIFPEVLKLTEMSGEDHSWQFSTALGLPLAPTTPLELTGLRHGDVVIMEPRHSYPAPVVRDCADAIGDTAGEVALYTPVCVTSWILAVVALIALGLQCQIPLWGIAAGIAGVGAVLSVWSSLTITLSLTTILSCSVAVYLVVAQGAQHWQDRGLALLSAVGMSLLMVTVLTVFHRLPLQLSTALLSAGLAGLLGAGVLAWSGKPLTAGSVLLLVSLVASLKAPSVAVVLAGVPLPVLPAAGEDLSVSDNDSQEDIHHTAHKATALHAGLMIAVGATATLGCVIIAVHGGLFSQATCLTAAGAFILHAVRHRYRVPVWSLLLPGLSSVAGVALGSQAPGDIHSTLSLVLGALAALALSTVPLWAAHLKEITPTTQMWLERAETLCIAALIPLSAQVAGMFYAIRSLG